MYKISNVRWTMYTTVYKVKYNTLQMKIDCDNHSLSMFIYYILLNVRVFRMEFYIIGSIAHRRKRTERTAGGRRVSG
jgi:predicted CDP-diglyceride synthetase/phosphatidate cytidylyltransferase